MIKNRTFWVLTAALFFNFCFINKSFAIENTEVKSKYPDYSYEFVGNDKFESFNRKIFTFNLKANKYVIKPINIVWASVMPQYGIDRVNSFYTNMKYPIRLMGCLLQKDFESSRSETKRFFINTTMGVVGLYDPAQTKYKIEPRQEDIEQVLAYYNWKRGPYLVLPVVAQGNIRDLAGQALDMPLNPTSYIVGPIALASTGVSLVNETTSMQSIFKMAETYADPYEIAKQAYGLDKYIKNSNIDRSDVLKEKTASQKIIKINNLEPNSSLKADVKLNNYNPQTPLVDSMRTILFDNENLNNSKWSELSVWNKSFSKQIKTASVNINSTRPSYKYRYVLQKDKTAPLAIIYPSIGEGVMSSESMVQAKLLYDQGYSVVIQGSSFNWEFIRSMPDGYRPGLPTQDAKYLRLTTSKIINDLQTKNACIFNKKILVGTSFGALTSLFAAEQEDKNNTLGISNYIVINPPIKIFYALQQLDKYTEGLNNNQSDIKERAAITAEKVMQVSQIAQTSKPESLPFVNDEARLAIGFAMKQKLSDVVFTIENGSKISPVSKKQDLYKLINNMSFYDYAQKYLISVQGKSVEQLDYESSLYSLTNFLKENKKYKIYHTLDDCFVNQDQLAWLKKQTNNKSIFFSNGSHLGFLYRKEFIDEFTKDIKFQNVLTKEGL